MRHFIDAAYTSIPQFKRMARAVKHVLYQDSSCNVNVELDSTSRKPLNVVQIYMWIYNDIILYMIYTYIYTIIYLNTSIIHSQLSIEINLSNAKLCPVRSQNAPRSGVFPALQEM